MNKNEAKGIPCERFSRIVGYYRPVANWNKGKQEEFKDRKPFNIGGYGEYNTEDNCQDDRVEAGECGR